MEVESKIYFVPNKLAMRAGIAGAWRSANELGVFPNIPIHHNTPDKLSDYAPDDASLFNVRPHVILFNPIIRKMVNESNGAFLDIQAFMSRNPDSSAIKTELLKFSRYYRSIIRACLEHLQDEVMRAPPGETKHDLQSFVTIFYSIECIWHFSEIIFVENILGNAVLPQLLDWVRFHLPTHERNAAALLCGPQTGLDLQPTYWDTVIGCIIQGRLEVASALLRLHSDGDSDQFRLCVAAIQTFPVYSIQGGVSASEHQAQCRSWQIETQSNLEAKHYYISDNESTENLEFIVKLMLGEETAWIICAQEHCETWYELLAGWLLYIEPTVQRFDLGRYASRCISRMSDSGNFEMKHLDQVLLAAMEGDFEFITELQHLTENGWCITHLTDLLYHCGQLVKWQPDLMLASNLRETFLLDYGTLLMSNKSLWQVGLSYIDHCPRKGAATACTLLMHIPINSTIRAEQVVREALKRNLDTVVKSICKVQALRQLQHGHLGNALNWGLKSQEPNFITFLADKYLRNYTKSGQFQNLDLLENLGPNMLLSDRLMFLGKYCEFHKIYVGGDYKSAAELLMALVESKLTPKYFWRTLFLDIAPLLECEKIFSSNDNTILTNYFEDKMDNGLDKKEEIQMIRMALAKNLRRALIEDHVNNC